MAEQSPPPADKPPSKLPDLKELGSMANKLFQGVKSSIVEIVEDYKAKRAESADPTPKPTSEAPPEPQKPQPETTTAPPEPPKTVKPEVQPAETKPKDKPAVDTPTQDDEEKQDN